MLRSRIRPGPISSHTYTRGDILSVLILSSIRKPIHRHYIHRLCLHAYAEGKFWTVAILGLPTGESVRLRWGQLLLNLLITPKSILMTLSLSIYPISMGFSLLAPLDSRYHCTTLTYSQNNVLQNS